MNCNPWLYYLKFVFMLHFYSLVDIIIDDNIKFLIVEDGLCSMIYFVTCIYLKCLLAEPMAQNKIICGQRLQYLYKIFYEKIILRSHPHVKGFHLPLCSCFILLKQ